MTEHSKAKAKAKQNITKYNIIKGDKIKQNCAKQNNTKPRRRRVTFSAFSQHERIAFVGAEQGGWGGRGAVISRLPVSRSPRTNRRQQKRSRASPESIQTKHQYICVMYLRIAGGLALSTDGGSTRYVQLPSSSAILLHRPSTKKSGDDSTRLAQPTASMTKQTWMTDERTGRKRGEKKSETESKKKQGDE